jgi:PDZ domain-containing protein
MSTIADPKARPRSRRRWPTRLDAFAAQGREEAKLKSARLRGHPLLAGCSLSVMRRVLTLTDEVSVPAGDTLVQQGRSAEWFFLIHSGQAEVVRDGIRLGVLGPGEHFGEVALLGRGMQPATVRALSPMTVFVIGSQRFLPLVEDTRSLRVDMDAALARQADLVQLARAERARRINPPRPAVHPPAVRVRAEPRPIVRRPQQVVRLALQQPPPERRSARWRTVRAAAATALVVSVAIVAGTYHPPLGVVAPGPVIDVGQDITISGVPVHRPGARYLLVTVRTRRPSLLGVGLAALHRNTAIVRVDAASGSQARQAESRLVAQFDDSQTDAAAAAARALGLPVGPSGALSFKVRFRHRDVVGPSGGLIYALAIADMLGRPSTVDGQVVAATGVIDAAGNVKAVGFVAEKAAAARRAGAQVLLVPQGQADDASGPGVLVQGVGSLREALLDLAAPVR